MDVTAIGCDVATTTGRKWLRGPRGTGLLYVRTGFAERLSPPGVGGSAAVWEDAHHYALRPGTERLLEFEVSIAAHLGLGVAIDHALHIGIEAIAARVTGLAERLRQGLASLEGVTVHDGGLRRCGIVTFTSARATPIEIKERASAAGVNLSVTEAPWARLDMAPPHPTTVVRASPHYYNTDVELDLLMEVVAR